MFPSTPHPLEFTLRTPLLCTISMYSGVPLQTVAAGIFLVVLISMTVVVPRPAGRGRTWVTGVRACIF